MIVPMKKATVFALRKDRAAILLALQRAAILMVVENDGSVRDKKLNTVEQSVQDTQQALNFMKKYRKQPGMLTPLPLRTYADILTEHEEGLTLAGQARKIEEQMAQLDAVIAAGKSNQTQLEPWLPLEIPVGEIRETRNAVPITGYIPVAGALKLEELAEEYPLDVTILGRTAGSSAALLVCLKDVRDEISEKLKGIGFVVSSPPAVKGLVRDEYARIENEIADAEEQLDALKEQAKEAGSSGEELDVLYDKLNADLARADTPYEKTDATFFLNGWFEADRRDELEETLHDATDVFELIVEDAAEGEKAPTLTRNNKFIRPFESITDMFSRPNPIDGVDPNPVMAPWYWIIFGMMMADAGYGLIMAVLIGGYLLIKRPPPETSGLWRVMLFGSVTTAFWGVIFGSYFGAELFPPLITLADGKPLTPMGEPLILLMVCVGLGYLHLATGMLVKAYYLIKEKDYGSAIVDQFAWILMIPALVGMFLPQTKSIAQWIVLGLLAVILFFPKGGVKNPIKRFGSGLLSIYFSASGFIGDLLSYSRIMALILSSGVIGMVMNTLAGMVKSGGGVVGWIGAILIYIAGHLFNLVMGLLSAYVHAGRLQYVEMFGKFYEGGGYQFKPLAVRSKTAVIAKERKKS